MYLISNIIPSAPVRSQVVFISWPSFGHRAVIIINLILGHRASYLGHRTNRYSVRSLSLDTALSPLNSFATWPDTVKG